MADHHAQPLALLQDLPDDGRIESIEARFRL